MESPKNIPYFFGITYFLCPIKAKPIASAVIKKGQQKSPNVPSKKFFINGTKWVIKQKSARIETATQIMPLIF